MCTNLLRRHVLQCGAAGARLKHRIVVCRSRTRNSAQFEGCPSTHNGIALDGQQPHPGDVLKRNLESDDVPRQSKKHKGHIWVFSKLAPPLSLSAIEPVYTPCGAPPRGRCRSA